MKSNFTKIVIITCLLILSGCKNLSPRQDQKLENNGKIDEIKNNQNGIMSEIGTLKNQAEIQNSQLEKIQQGMMNLQSTNENSGVQILSGPGGLASVVVILTCVSLLMIHYRTQCKLHEKTANILTEKIIQKNDPSLEDDVFLSVINTNVEENVLNLMKKHKLSQ